jgi:hypothetical protein
MERVTTNAHSKIKSTIFDSQIPMENGSESDFLGAILPTNK